MKNKFFGCFTDLTGGLVVKDDTEKPELAVQEITTFSERMRRSYIIGFKPSGGRSKGRLVKIKVELSPQARKKNKDAQLRYRRGYIVAAGEGGESNEERVKGTEWEQPGALTQS